MKKTIIHILSVTGRTIVIALALLALVLGANVSILKMDRLAARPTTAAASTLPGPQLLPGPQSDEAAGKMATNSKPNYCPVGIITAVALSQSDHERKNFRNQLPQEITPASEERLTDRADDPISSVFAISPDVGRQFTLVGSRPSGTS